MNKKIIVCIASLAIILSGTTIFFLYDNSEFRYYLGTQTGLKDKPFLHDENFLIEQVIVGIQSSTALTIIDDDLIFLEKETLHRRTSFSNLLFSDKKKFYVVGFIFTLSIF